jgi:hypothetical protein
MLLYSVTPDFGGRMMLRTFSIFVVAFIMGSLLVGCSTVPDHNDAWLSFKYSFTCGDFGSCGDMSDLTEATNYYQALGINSNNYFLSTFKADNGFGTLPEVGAIYGNNGDLQVGREMHCAQTGQKTACYVRNWGPAPQRGHTGGWPDLIGAMNEADGTITDDGSNTVVPFGTVAMVYDPTKGGPNNVSFFAFDRNESLILAPSLDEEGDKTVPRMCMSCHGGQYHTNNHSATGASFLPFDVFYFRTSSKPGFTYDDQAESFRQLNAMVASTNPAQPILDFIGGTYPDGVTNAQSPAVDGYIPPGWASNANLYQGVVRQYCRMCHMAQPETFTDLAGFQSFASQIEHQACDTHDMPHAQVPFGVNGKKIGFWNDLVAQHDLGNFLRSQGISNTCLPHD